MFEIDRVTVNGSCCPLGVDNSRIYFQWQLKSDERHILQNAYSLTVQDIQGTSVWDSGWIEQRRLTCEVDLNLLPCTEYVYMLRVKDNYNHQAQQSGTFETGFLTGSQNSWCGAKWIGAAVSALDAQYLPTYVLELEFRFQAGAQQAGFVFGADDWRLKQPWTNEMRVSDSSRISYVVNVCGEEPSLKIYRVGYDRTDRREVPFAEMPLREYGTGRSILTKDNLFDRHTLKVEVTGSSAFAYMDGFAVDQVPKQRPNFDADMDAAEMPEPQGFEGRQLNPLGRHDCPLYPMLCHVGLTSNGPTVFHSFRIRNRRHPGAVLFELPETSLDGEILFDPSHGGETMLRRQFFLPSPPVKARLYVACRGIYDGEINGHPLSEAWFLNGAAQYDRHIPYRVFNVTDLLNAGENALGFTLASGWYSKDQTFSMDNFNYWGDRESLLVKLQIKTADGTDITLVSDESWSVYTDGPVRSASFFQGEHYDATLSQKVQGFSTPEYDASEWDLATVISSVDYTGQNGNDRWPAPQATPAAYLSMPDNDVREWARLTAVSCTEVEPGTYVYDMGQNLVGVPDVLLFGDAGTTAVLRYAEVLYPLGYEEPGLVGHLMTENYREATSIDRYRFRGDASGERFLPRFTFHGFRYIEISGVTKRPELDHVQAVALSSLRAPTGEIRTSDEQVNRLFENIRWSQYGNSVSIPTDCPQRNERMGWAGDAQVFADTAVLNTNALNFYQNYLVWLRDCQLENGQYPCIAPVGGGFGGIAWESAGIILPYVLWQHYGLRTVIEENYAAMCRYICYLGSKGTIGVLTDVGPLGDWLAADYSTDKPLLWNAIAVYDLKLLARMSAEIDRKEDSRTYAMAYQQARQVWNDTFVSKTDGRAISMTGTPSHTQCAYALPLAYDILTPENRTAFSHWLEACVRDSGYTVTTGFLGTGLLCPALTAAGHTEAAYHLLHQEHYPSWLYSVKQGATTIWERWNSYTEENGFGGHNTMNSFNHYSLGAIGKWLYNSVLGIRSGETPGWERFCLEPQIMSLTAAKGQLDSPCGEIRSAWEKKQDGHICWKFSVPAGCEAEVRIPADFTLMSGGEHLTPGTPLIAGSGDYVLQLVRKLKT